MSMAGNALTPRYPFRPLDRFNSARYGELVGAEWTVTGPKVNTRTLAEIAVTLEVFLHEVVTAYHKTSSLTNG
jgi:hypothetical protein